LSSGWYADGNGLGSPAAEGLQKAGRGIVLSLRGLRPVAGNADAHRVGGIRRGGGRHRAMEFVAAPLPVPSLARPVSESTLYIRVSAPVRPSDARTPAQVAVLEAASAAVRAELQAALTDVFDALADEGVPFVWRTRAGIKDALPPGLAVALLRAGSTAVVELGIPSLDPVLCAALEGGADVVHAAPDERIRLASALTARGVAVRGLIDPLVPLLTDQQGPLTELTSALADAGVTRVGARYVALTKDRARALAHRLSGMHRAVLDGVFAQEPWRKPDPQETGVGKEVHKLIPAHLRRQGHQRLLEAGASAGVVVDILDPVSEGSDLSGPPQPARSERTPRPVRRRPQLELFRKGR
jgi:hypothetical protein